MSDLLGSNEAENNMTQQVETATVVGTIGASGAGNATVIVTSVRMSGSPKTISVAVSNNDTASLVASAIRTALAFDADVSATFLVSGATDKVILTEHVSASNDTTLNISIDNGTCTGLTAAPTSANTTAGVGITNGYCTLADLKSSSIMNLPSTVTFNDDQILCDIITAVSRGIDKQTSRFFYKSASAETKYFTAVNTQRIYVGDIVSVSALYTDNLSGDRTYPFTWSSTDYDLWPYEADSLSEAEPFRYIETTPRGLYQFPINVAKGIKLTAVFGWPAVPELIARACLLWSHRVYKRYSTPIGSQAMSELGAVGLRLPPPDPDVEMMINNYRLVSA